MGLNTSKNCKKVLSDFKKSFVCSCGFRGEPYTSKVSFTRICPECKKKYSPTNGTIFHNNRFGLLKAFKIAKKEVENNFSSSSTEIAKEFKITQKTAWHFLKKIRNNKPELISIFDHYDKSNNKSFQYNTTKSLNNEIKLINAYVNEMIINGLKLEEINKRLDNEGINDDIIKMVTKKVKKDK